MIQTPRPSVIPHPPVDNGYSVFKDNTDMGATVSLPGAQASFIASGFAKHAQRQKHLPPVAGSEAYNAHHSQDSYQQFDPYQEFNRLPHLMSSGAAPVRGKPLIFAAMEANIDQQQPGEEHKVSVRVWDGQGQDVTGYMNTPSTQDQKLAKATNDARTPQNAGIDRSSPTLSEATQPRQKETESGQDQSQNAAGTSSPRPRKLSKPRSQQADTHSQRNASRPITPVKGRPVTPGSPNSQAAKVVTPTRLGTPIQFHVSSENLVPQILLPPSRDGGRNSGIMLLDMDGDPFAKTEGVRMLAPILTAEEKKEREQEKDKEAKRTNTKNAELSQEWRDGASVKLKKSSLEDVDGDGMPIANSTKVDTRNEQITRRAEKRMSRIEEAEVTLRENDVEAMSPSSHGFRPRTRTKQDNDSASIRYTIAAKGKDKQPPVGLMDFVSNPRLFGELLSYLSFYEWCVLASVSKNMRNLLSEKDSLRELVLERFLKTVGYARWSWEGRDPLPLSLQDLSDYMLGVSTPTHEYARVADLYVRSISVHPMHRDRSLYETVNRYTAATRSYSRVVIRLRAQAEKDVSGASPRILVNNLVKGSMSHPSSRAPSPTQSTFSHAHSQHGHAMNGSVGASLNLNTNGGVVTGFKSPLFRRRRAPLLRVFVPSPDGDWLSDKSVLECEAECRRAGIVNLMRFGDVVWDMAVGDEGNIGRLIWDGSYLLDLDYSYSPVGDLPKYVPALAFPPSYFHKVIRTGLSSSNPVVHIDISPWGEEIATNLQLLQDRVRTETPQGAQRNVVRWMHRSSFVIRPPSNNVRARGQSPHARPRSPGRIPIPDAHGLFVDPGWYGTIIVETEGTNESLADLQDRCGPGAFPPRANGVARQMGINPAADARKVFRILRGKSRPGEIWIKAVSIKEKLL
ncbi:hypothetical protein AX17_006012 [Amanita inopinata Kibby_2008]|nr:hypothetical protein AX17_006012 [Amanita inopinata Kibby_2008]